MTLHLTEEEGNAWVVNGGLPSRNPPSVPITPSAVGMSLRDYFAGQALIACMSNDRWVSGLDKAAIKSDSTFSVALAETVYRYADAMLKERDKGKS